MATQLNWRWCNKCHGLAFVGTASIGRCATGGFHNYNGSGKYALVQGDPQASGQANWRWCRKCQVLAFAGGSKIGDCPAGRQHDHSGSQNFVLTHGVGAGQDNWRWCKKCQMLTFAGTPQPGKCPSGGEHDHSGSGNYILEEETNSKTVNWALAPVSAGKIDFNGGSIIAQQNGRWQFYGSLHDHSFWYRDNWAFGFVFGDTGHGVVASGNLGTESGSPPVYGGFDLTGVSPWIAQNWPTVATSGIHDMLKISGSLSDLIDAIADDLKRSGPPFVSIVASL